MKKIFNFFRRHAIQRRALYLLKITREIRDELRYVTFKLWLDIKPEELATYQRMHDKKMFKVSVVVRGKRSLCIALKYPVSNVTVIPYNSEG